MKSATDVQLHQNVFSGPVAGPRLDTSRAAVARSGPELSGQQTTCSELSLTTSLGLEAR